MGDNNKKERKSILVTVRVTDKEMQTAEQLSDALGRTKSDAIMRAWKFFVNSNGNVADEDDVKERVRKNHQVHLRMSGSDMNDLANHGEKIGATTSQIIRKSIVEFERFMRNRY